MMKKLSKLAALLAATALLFGAIGCSNDDDDGNETEQPGGGDGTGGDNTGSSGDQGSDYTGAATTDSWNFVSNETVSGIVTGGTNTGASDGVTFSLSDAKDVKGSDGNLMLTLQSAKVTVGSMTSGAIPVYAYNAENGLRFKNNALKIAGVKGKVVLSFDYTAAGTSARNLEVTVGETTKKTAVSDTTTHDYEQEIDAGSGTDIYIGADNNFWVKGLKITENKASFNSATNSDTTNDLVTLGLVGTKVESSADTIAKAEIKDGKIAITSVAAGDAEITVTDKNDKTAKIPVTVKSSGEVEVGTIARFTRSAPTASEKTNANASAGTKGSVKVTGDGLTALEYSQDGTNFVDAATAGITVAVDGAIATVTNLDAGTYYVRGAASEDYEASAALTVGIGNDGAAKTTDSWAVADISQFTALTTKGTISADITVSGANGSLELTASAAGTGIGTSKMGKTASSYQYIKDKGLLIKKDALKVAGVKGSVKLTVEWYCNSDESSKEVTERRMLEVTVGANGATKTQAVNTIESNSGKTQGKMDDFTLDVDGGTDGVDIYIGSSNEVYIQKIIVE